MHIKDTFPELYQLRRPVRLERLRQQLGEKQGKEYWRSLEELADTPEFEDFLHREFPSQASEWQEGTDRRTFLKVMGASLALAGLSGCVYQPPEQAVPYVRQPEEIIPGKPLYFATAMPMPGGAVGLLARSNMGRPTKLEGNEMHPASLGSTDIYAQASLLTMYDPDRSQTPRYRGDIRSYTAFLAEIMTVIERQRPAGGAGVRFLTESIISPTVARQMQEITQRLPNARWIQYDAAGAHGAREGARQTFGQYVNTVYRFDQADRVLALDSDFLTCGAGSLRYSRDFMNRRRVGEGHNAEEMNRLYVVETTPTSTGLLADHRLAIRPSEMESFARAIAARLGASSGTQGAQSAGASVSTGSAERDRFADAVARDLQSKRGRTIIIVGNEQPASVHALAHAMNNALGNVGSTVIYTETVEFNPADQLTQLRELVTDIDAGRVETLIIVGGNPVYNTPVDLKLDAERLAKVNLRVHLSLYHDETSELCQWHIPEAHYLESWSDARAFDGTVSIIQPLIAPLYEGKTVHEFLAAFTDRPERSSLEVVRETWQAQNTAGGDFEQWWRRVVHDGIVPNTAFQPRAGGGGAAATGQTGAAQTQQQPAQQPTSTPAPQSGNAGGLEIVFRPDPSIHDGRFANNGWLQELPKPLTKLTWDNVAMMSVNTARGLNLHYGNSETSRGSQLSADVVRLSYRGQTVNAPVWIMPGQPDGVVTVHLGYGRTRAGRVGTGTRENPVGFDAYKIRPSDAMWSGAGLEVASAGSTYPLASTQTHFNMEGRDIVREGTVEQYRAHPELAPPGTHHAPPGGASMYPEHRYEGYAWGMAIDLGTCVGCNACIVACQAENNIPVVGKDQISRSREMHWLRVDAYFRGAVENPESVSFMPVPCMHCENAPCEPVCPVHATVHSAEGLNDMVYNRCVGTRYCSNNCPYKVRRFNFLLYQDFNTPSLKLMRNPEVSVRSRGVMEKCTYCVQRIEFAKIEAEKEGRRVRDGEVVTACQAACPTQAIIFGDTNDPASRVAQLKHEPRNYALLHELQTQPRTTYLARVRNPNPELPHSSSAHGQTEGH